MSPPAQTRTAFFYGTLMAPPVLHRVIHGTPTPPPTHTLSSRPAVLPAHRRHRVRHADYPAIVECASSSVRGTLVAGLTDAMVRRLDLFEGGEYERVVVGVELVGEERGEGGDVEGDRRTVQAETYVWCAGEAALEAGEWDFEEFRRAKMRFWVGEGDGEEGSLAGDGDDIAQDGTGGRGANGHITSALKEEQAKEEVMRSAV